MACIPKFTVALPEGARRPSFSIRATAPARTAIRAFGGGFSFPSPYGIALDASGFVWAVDYNNNWVGEFTGTGIKVNQFGVTGGNNGQIFHPTYIAAH